MLDSKHFLRNVVDVGLSMVPDGDALLAVNTKLEELTTQELLKKKLRRRDEALEKKSAEVVQLKAAQRTYFECCIPGTNNCFVFFVFFLFF